MVDAMIDRDADNGAQALRARVPDGLRLYVIGDIHGRRDLLVRLHDRIVADAEAAAGLKHTVIYLGDYVDRGPESFEVLDRLINEPLAGFDTIHLKGNHEDMMLAFLSGAAGSLWTGNGGIETLGSYGLQPPPTLFDGADLESLRYRLRRAIPSDHVRFLEGLRLCHTEGDYFFVHAGVRPGKPLADQDPREMMWIRDPFLGSNASFGKRVVHGHSPCAEPEVSWNRIGIDTGACWTGRLTCLVLEGDAHRFLQT